MKASIDCPQSVCRRLGTGAGADARDFTRTRDIQGLAESSKLLMSIAMTVIDHEPARWFLVRDNDRFYLDVNCSQSAVSYSFLLELNEGEINTYATEGHAFLSDLADKINNSAFGSALKTSPYRERHTHSETGEQVNAAISAWIKARGNAV